MSFTKYLSKFINYFRLLGKWKHIYRVKKAKKIIQKIKIIASTNGGYAKSILYLRKINPYVFEELILTVIENSNIRIYRNKRYSGDGGVDGIFKIKQGKVLIQCKRYSRYINPQHVQAFAYEIQQKYYKGIFVHTGKTGDKSKFISQQHNKLIILSGTHLIDVIIGKNTILEKINLFEKIKSQ